MAKRYACFGGVTKLKHLFGSGGHDYASSNKGLDCEFYRRKFFSKPTCKNKETPDPSNVPREECESYTPFYCFIATEIFGPDAEETNSLREWRDESLETSPIGKLAVEAYYATSPEIVKLLKRYPALRGPVKSGLSHFVDHLRTKQTDGTA